MKIVNPEIEGGTRNSNYKNMRGKKKKENKIKKNTKLIQKKAKWEQRRLKTNIKQVKKMKLNPNITINTLNVNGINPLIKRQRW